MEYIIYCDESLSKGRYSSDFYGGSLVRSKDLSYVQAELKEVMKRNNLMAEIKWTKVTHKGRLDSRKVETFQSSLKIYAKEFEIDESKFKR